MKGGNLSRHKRTKFGQLPGDLTVQAKACMIEKGVQPRFRHLSEQTDEERRRHAKSFKRDFVRMANRRSRRAPVETDGL